ncbi:hypothetical protein [Phthorimaea operculella granulovirus]|uniref:Uncharacterized protein n=1 Tax=Phthorimaea operculella granulovirus TaxID=192584 RepID=Q8JRW1_9BBAC|nr:hypothetical protein [Phthorimaea operculella granulovirus]AAM70296.1 hypothetical protein [Phthorimaea operculella granulovirus]ANY57487.1 hypothetical protein PhopGVgp098 [Phthorimaea operculella granulovirus]QBH65933.1 hypothetical protein PhopGVgp098 [Phthorimaea operculella granulovirus]QBH66063.1 hypothetical protein PhopGVgp098 [Phthorimaea operculella granulovirus]QBH66193.1 hypothetical protein PhopGVgp098 [Phthorimaea operculella granulovirus]
MNKIKLNLSMLPTDTNVEPISLKLAHNTTAPKIDNATTNLESSESMWYILFASVFILAVIFLISYFLVSRYNDGRRTSTYEEDYG